MDQSLQVMFPYNDLWKPAGLNCAENVIASQFCAVRQFRPIQWVPAFERYVRHCLNAFPNLQFAVEDWLTRDGQVAVRYSFTGTHERDFMGVVTTGRSTTTSVTGPSTCTSTIKRRRNAGAPPRSNREVEARTR